MKIQMIGIQGSGKSTIGKEVAKALGLPFYTMSDLIRNAVHDADVMVISQYTINDINEGRLAPDSVINYLLKSIKEDSYVMDGYIRTAQQCSDFCSTGTINDYIVQLTIPEELAISRMFARNRPDDTPHAIKRRIGIFNENITDIKNSIFNVNYVVSSSHLMFEVNVKAVLDQIQ
jgi:adenylate kinase family enzyme